jgi:hypothetical protein
MLLVHVRQGEEGGRHCSQPQARLTGGLSGSTVLWLRRRLQRVEAKSRHARVARSQRQADNDHEAHPRQQVRVVLRGREGDRRSEQLRGGPSVQSAPRPPQPAVYLPFWGGAHGVAGDSRVAAEVRPREEDDLDGCSVCLRPMGAFFHLRISHEVH